MNTDVIIEELKSFGSEEQAANLSRFFRTGKGEYGEGDVFLGVKVPQTDVAAKKYWREVSFDDLDTMISSPYHEVRMCALAMLQYKYFFLKKLLKKDPTMEEQMAQCIDFYLGHTAHINNWDLVDLTATKMLCDWLLNRDKKVLYDFVKSSSLWEQRIAIVTTIGFVREDRFEDALNISAQLLSHKHDLIHKAVGWTLREVGKHDRAALDAFLEAHVKGMPRTTLRYAIEKHTPEERAYWMSK